MRQAGNQMCDGHITAETNVQTGNHSVIQEGSVNHGGISCRGRRVGALGTACLLKGVVPWTPASGLPAVTPE